MASRTSRVLFAAVTATATATAIALAGCANVDPDASLSSDSDAGTSEQTLRYAIWSNPNGTFNPLTYNSNYDRAVIFTVYGRLFVLNEDQSFEPSLASGYEYSDDERTLTVTLREGVTWHDGEPFTAEDVAFTYTAAADGGFPLDTHEFATALEGFEAYNSGESDTLSGIEVVDEHTVSFTFSEPFAGALSYFADRPVLAKHVWEDTPVSEWNEATELLRNPVGTGPFVFDEFAPDQYVSLTANDDYFEGAPELDSVIFRVSNTETAQTELLNGELDIAEISSWNQGDLDTYTNGGADVIEQVGVTAQYLTLDSQNPIFSDERVRQAFVYGIDRQGIIDSLLFGHGIVFNSDAHPDDPFYPDDLEEYAYDPDRAAELLAEAGWTDSDGDGILDRDGEDFVFTLNFPTGNTTRELSAPIIQSNLQDLGIDVRLVSGDFNSTLAILQDGERRYDGVLMGGTFRPDRYENNHWWERYQSDELDALAARYNSTVDSSR